MALWGEIVSGVPLKASVELLTYYLFRHILCNNGTPSLRGFWFSENVAKTLNSRFNTVIEYKRMHLNLNEIYALSYCYKHHKMSNLAV